MVGSSRRLTRHPRLLLATALLAVALGLGACSPESDRAQGGGRGADIGNRGDPVELRGDQSAEDRIYFETPREANYD